MLLLCYKKLSMKFFEIVSAQLYQISIGIIWIFYKDNFRFLFFILVMFRWLRIFSVGFNYFYQILSFFIWFRCWKTLIHLGVTIFLSVFIKKNITFEVVAFLFWKFSNSVLFFFSLNKMRFWFLILFFE